MFDKDCVCKEISGVHFHKNNDLLLNYLFDYWIDKLESFAFMEFLFAKRACLLFG